MTLQGNEMGFCMWHEKSVSFLYISIVWHTYKIGLSCQFSGKALTCIWRILVRGDTKNRHCELVCGAVGSMHALMCSHTKLRWFLWHDTLGHAGEIYGFFHIIKNILKLGLINRSVVENQPSMCEDLCSILVLYKFSFLPVPQQVLWGGLEIPIPLNLSIKLLGLLQAEHQWTWSLFVF